MTPDATCRLPGNDRTPAFNKSAPNSPGCMIVKANSGTRPTGCNVETNERGCNVCSKRIFPTFEQARVALIAAAFARAYRRTKRRERRAYYCPKCGGWHLTARVTGDPWGGAISEAQRLGATR